MNYIEKESWFFKFKANKEALFTPFEVIIWRKTGSKTWYIGI